MKQKTETPKTLQGQYAGFVSRFLALTVDIVVVILTITVVGITTDMFIRFFGMQDIIETVLTSEGVIGDVVRFLGLLGSIAIISFAYFVFGWTLTGGQSVGKILVGVRIVPLNGKKIGLTRATLRYIAFLFSAVILFLGLLWVLISDNRQGWHDKIARTCVIYDWPAREDDGVFGRWQVRMKRSRITRRFVSSSPSSDESVAENQSEAATEEAEAV